MKTQHTLLNLLISTVALVALAHALTGCAAAPRMHAPAMAPMEVAPAQQQPAAPQVLTENHFRSDRLSNLGEDDLAKILDAPVFLEELTRVGIVPVATAYEVDKDIPLAIAPQRLSEQLEETGLFDVTTEVSTDWPKVNSVAGLRELAARYRVKYLLLYRHRFVEDDYTNAWGWSWATVVGGLVTPSTTLRSAGVMEASLFDVRTGTILFTVFERVYGDDNVTVWNTEQNRQELKQRLLGEGLESLTVQMNQKVRRLEIARQRHEEKQEALAAKRAEVLRAAPQVTRVQPEAAPKP